jgi:methionyl aminopeptidase
MRTSERASADGSLTSMSIDTPEELAAMRRVGALVAKTLRVLREHVRPGVTTGELDAIAAREFAREGARSGPILTYNFPGHICISVNDEIVHGIPGARVLRDGDLVKLDVTPELDGYFADAAISVPVGRPSPEIRRLLRAADACLESAIATATTGTRLRAIGAATARTAEAHRATPFGELRGHGIGRRLHEAPTVPNIDLPRLRQRLEAGLVLAIEPMLTLGADGLRPLDDGWTIATADGSIAAHVEHTVVVADGRPLVLTA